MAVNVTPNLGLLKPTSDEIARFWANPDDAPESPISLLNNTAIDEVPGSLTLREFTPVLESTGTNPNLGTGDFLTQFGAFRVIGDWVFLWATIRFGNTGTSNGTGTYHMVLPTAVGPGHISGATGFQDVLGEGVLRDNSTIATSQTCATVLINPSVPSIRWIMDDSTAGQVTNTLPFTWTVGDAIRFNAVYEYGGELP